MLKIKSIYVSEGAPNRKWFNSNRIYCVNANAPLFSEMQCCLISVLRKHPHKYLILPTAIIDSCFWTMRYSIGLEYGCNTIHTTIQYVVEVMHEIRVLVFFFFFFFFAFVKLSQWLTLPISYRITSWVLWGSSETILTNTAVSNRYTKIWKITKPQENTIANRLHITGILLNPKLLQYTWFACVPSRWLWIADRSLDDILLSLRKYCLGHSFCLVSDSLDWKFVTT